MTISVLQAQLFFLAFTRIMAVLIHVPVLGGQSIPNEYRIGFGALLTIVLVPWQPVAVDAESLGFFMMTTAIFREILLGTLAGFAASLTFGAVHIAAEAMGMGSGFSSSHIFNPAMGDSGSSYNQFFVIFATLFFLVIDGHHGVIIALQRSFEALPVNSTWAIGSPEGLISMTSMLIVAGIQLALPVVFALLLTDITLGLLARVAPQVQVYFLGLPLKVGVALVGMSLLIMTSLPLLRNLFLQIGPRMLALLER
jgi:flagellar biosynthetic protein FliR